MVALVSALRRGLPACLLLIALGAQAREVEVEGAAAIIDGGVTEARQQALEDALRQAALYGGASVHSATVVVNNALAQDSTRVAAHGEVTLLAVIREWQADDAFHVLIKARVEDQPPAPSLASPGGYRKKIAFTQFEVLNRSDVQDLPGIERLLPQRLAQAVEQSGQLLTIDASRYLFSALAQQHSALGEVPPRALVSSLAAELGAQVVVQGVIRSLATVSEGFAYRRMVVVEIRVMDGISGVVIGSHAYRDSVAGGRDVLAENGFEDPALDRQPLGALLQRLVREQAVLLAADVQILPFSARVLRNEGDAVYIDAGAVNRIKVGDSLTAYHLAPQALTVGGQFAGYSERPVATVVVKKVQPLFALGQLSDPAQRLQPGDIVRISP